MESAATNVNADLSQPAVMDSAAMSWEASPSGTVWRKRLSLRGPKEAGVVTSVVRYEPGATFPAHDHPDGEEILVLEGTFSDEHGDWPAGTLLLNPEGFDHAPFSRAGCVLFVRLRQYAGQREQLTRNIRRGAWMPGEHRGLEVMELYRSAAFPDRLRLERWQPQAPRRALENPAGCEMFVLEGRLEVDGTGHGPGTWLRFPPRHCPLVGAARVCEVYVRRGHLGGPRIPTKL